MLISINIFSFLLQKHPYILTVANLLEDMCSDSNKDECMNQKLIHCMTLYHVTVITTGPKSHGIIIIIWRNM